jgi:hypothetical protein
MSFLIGFIVGAALGGAAVYVVAQFIIHAAFKTGLSYEEWRAELENIEWSDIW